MREESTGEKRVSAGVQQEMERAGAMLESHLLTRDDLVIVSTSPSAGARDKTALIQALAQRLRQAGVEVVVETDITTLEKRVAAENLQNRKICVVSAGGDGTLNLMASVLGPDVALIPFPLGTENLVAKHYKLCGENGEIDLERFVNTVIQGRLHRIDAGIATFYRLGKMKRQKLFLVMASVGFDAEVIRRMHLTRKGHISRWSYLKPILAAVRRYRYPRIRVENLESNVSGEPLLVAWALLFNVPRYAIGLEVESMADETDGKLDLCGLSRGSHLQGLRYLFGVLLRQHGRWSDVRRFRSTRFRLTSLLPAVVQLDGDYGGRLPMEVTVAPGRVLLKLPRDHSMV